jgi:N-acetylated-alpha-linked acidic dipeptidase
LSGTPDQYTGYAAVVIPRVNEAIDKHDSARTCQQIAVLAEALNRAAKVLGVTAEVVVKRLLPWP